MMASEKAPSVMEISEVSQSEEDYKQQQFIGVRKQHQTGIITPLNHMTNSSIDYDSCESPTTPNIKKQIQIAQRTSALKSTEPRQR